MTQPLNVAVLFRLLAAVETYRAEIESLLRCVFCADRLRRLARALAQIGTMSAAVPALSVHAAEIALMHQRLVAAVAERAACREPVMMRGLNGLARLCEAAACSARNRCTDLLLA